MITIGVLIAVFANIFSSFGFFFQKLAHHQVLKNTAKNADASLTEYSPLLDSSPPPRTKAKKAPENVLLIPVWYLGLVVLLGGELGKCVALIFAPPSTVAPITSVFICSNAAISFFLLREKNCLSFQRVFGVALTVLGVIAIAVWHPIATTSPNTLQASSISVKNNLQNGDWFWTALVITFLLLLLVDMSSEYGKRSVILYAVLASTCTTTSFLSVNKIVMTIKDLVLNIYNTTYMFWIQKLFGTMLVVGTSNFIALYYINKGIRYHSLGAFVPLNTVVGQILIVAGSIIINHDLKSLNDSSAMGYVIGFLLLIISIFFLSYESSPEHEDALISSQSSLTQIYSLKSSGKIPDYETIENEKTDSYDAITIDLDHPQNSTSPNSQTSERSSQEVDQEQSNIKPSLVTFQLTCEDLSFPVDKIAMVGNVPLLGLWDPSNAAIVENTLTSNKFVKSFTSGQLNRPMEYKFVAFSGDQVMWEHGPNRFFMPPEAITESFSIDATWSK